MDTTFIWLGVVFIAGISIVIPRIILAAVAWFMLDYGLGGGVILFICTVFAVMTDINNFPKK